MSKNYVKFEQTGYYKAIQNGTYYYPAWKHYKKRTNVFCDRCNRQNLKSCIGYQGFDLCLWCVDELTKSNYECLNNDCSDSTYINDTLVNLNKDVEHFDYEPIPDYKICYKKVSVFILIVILILCFIHKL